MTHTLEILLMLGVTLALGALLYHFGTSRRRRLLGEMRREVARLQALEAALTQRLERASADLESVRNDLAATARQLSEQPESSTVRTLADTLSGLHSQQGVMSEELAAIRQQVERLAPPAS